MKKLLVLVVALVMIVTVVSACASEAQQAQRELEGTWQRFDFHIQQPTGNLLNVTENDVQIEYTRSEITFTQSQMTRDGNVMIFEVSEDGNHIILERGGSERFNIEDGVLALFGTAWFRADSDEFNNHRNSIETQAEAELAEIHELIREAHQAEADRIAEEERLEAEWQAELETHNLNVQNMITEANTALSDLETAIANAEQHMQEQVIQWLVGDWHTDIRFTMRSNLPDNNFVMTDDITFNADGTWTHRNAHTDIATFTGRTDASETEADGYVNATWAQIVGGINPDEIRNNLILEEWQLPQPTRPARPGEAPAPVPAPADGSADETTHENTVNQIRAVIAELEQLNMNASNYLENVVLNTRGGAHHFTITGNSFGNDYFRLDDRSDINLHQSFRVYTEIRLDAYTFDRVQ